MSADAGLASNLATVVTPDGLRVMLHDTDRQGMFVRGSPIRPLTAFQTVARNGAAVRKNGKSDAGRRPHGLLAVH
jgi:hypothetical protein